LTWRSTIAFVPEFNSHGKKDVTGAFLPEAKKFLQFANGDGEGEIFRFDNRLTMAKRADQVLEHLGLLRGQRRKVRCVAFFCHGYKSGIQAGFRSSSRSKNIDDLAEAIASISGDGVIVPLYCCSTGGSPSKGAPGGDGGFADELRDALCRHGAVNCRVDSHTTVAHATKNPYVRRFEGRGSAVGGVGGQYLVPPGSKLWVKWRKALRGDTRLCFPWWDTGMVHERIS
jgi:hypothetical protein